jgi:hypothetical protein
MKKSFCILTISLGLILGITSFVYGFGVSPPFVNSTILTRGSHFESTVYLSRGDPLADSLAEVTIDAPEIAGWITIKQGNNFVMPKGEKLVPMTVMIDVPMNAEYKGYQGYIRVRSLPMGGTQGGQMSTVGGVRIDLGLAVTEKGVAGYSLKTVSVPTFEEGNPFTFLAVLINTGNVKIRPSKVHVDIYDLNRTRILVSGDVSGDTMEYIEPFQTKQIQGSFPLELAIGEYWADFSFYKEDREELFGKIDKIYFQIVPKGTLNPLVEKKGLSGSDYKLGLITILIVLVILTWINRDKIRKALKKKK